MHIGQRLKIKKRRKMGSTSKSSRKKQRWSRATSKNHSGVRVSSMFGAYLGPAIVAKKTITEGGKMPAWVINAVKERGDGTTLDEFDRLR